MSDDDSHLRLVDGRILHGSEVVWSPSVMPHMVFVLGLNCADHAKELALKTPEEPLALPKGPNTLIGHCAHTARPAGTAFMHYEYEPVVVIGRTARDVPCGHAYEYMAGYSMANGYAIRDYLENCYRPNLRVKSHDTGTPIGPWLADRDDVPDPMNLALRTTVNDHVTQEGSARDMVLDIPVSVMRFFSFMTLSLGDIILTSTSEGLADTRPGDEVIIEIEGTGKLVSTIVAEKPNKEPA